MSYTASLESHSLDEPDRAVPSSSQQRKYYLSDSGGILMVINNTLQCLAYHLVLTLRLTLEIQSFKIGCH